MASGYLFGNKFDTSTRSGLGQYYIIGRVKKVVLSEFIANTNKPDPDYNSPADIGKIIFELLYSSLSTSKSREVSDPAWPIFNFIKQYPARGEIVLIFPGPTSKLNDRSSRQNFFYFPPYDLWNHINHGAFPNLLEWAKFLNDNDVNKPGYSGQSTTSETKLPLGRTLEEKEDVYNLKPFEGDTIFQARFGQSIRFGSTVPVMKKSNNWSNKGANGAPITIITNSQGKRLGAKKFDHIVENINLDGSSIYLTHGQEINISDLILFPLDSFKTNIGVINDNYTPIQNAPVSNEVFAASEQDINRLS